MQGRDFQDIRGRIAHLGPIRVGGELSLESGNVAEEGRRERVVIRAILYEESLHLAAPLEAGGTHRV
jgi:hypothetical protein